MKNFNKLPIKFLAAKSLTALCLSIALIFSSNVFAAAGGLAAEVEANRAAVAALQNQLTALQNEINAETHEIGDVLSDGSIVFWVDETGRHGMAAQPMDAIDPNDSDDRMNWYLAKEVAENYGPGWHLPTKHELNLMYIKLHLNGVGGFANDFYWSSTESEANGAWDHDFVRDLQNSLNRDLNLSVRAVRAF